MAAFCSWRYRLNHRLTPGVRAHYSFKSCQLVTSWHQLIRREMIFKGLFRGDRRSAHPVAAFCCDVVYFTANGKIMSTKFGKVATNFFQCAISTSLRAALRMFSYRSRIAAL